MKNKTFFLTFVFLFITINIFTDNQTSTNKDFYNIQYSDGKKAYNITGARIICSPDSLIYIKGKKINLTKGRIWVTTTRKSTLKIIQNNNSFEINGATVDLNTLNNLVCVFNGNVYVSGKRVARGQAINLKNKEISSIQNTDEWQKLNLEMETGSVLIETQAKKETKEIFDKKLIEIIKNNYWTTSDNEAEFLVKINISDSDNRINGTIVYVSSGQIIGIIDEKTEEKNSAEINAINTGARILDIINSYKENELYSGRTLIIETTDLKNEDLIGFRKTLANIPGLKIKEEKNYYNIKNVFKLSYIGNGFDVAEMIKSDNANKKFNIWYVSKSKIKIKPSNKI